MLVVPLGPGRVTTTMEEYTSAVSRGTAKKGRRLVIARTGDESRFRILLYPFRTTLAASGRDARENWKKHPLGAAMPVIRERFGKLNPAPTREIPILIGGGGEKVTLRIVAENAHIWNGFGDPREAGRKSGILDDWCRKVGRDPEEIERSILGDPGQIINNADAYVENGITHLMLGFGGPDYDLTPLKELISWRDSYRERNPEVLAG